MIFDSSLDWKRRRLTDINPMDAELARTKLEAAKQKYGREIRVFETSTTSQAQPEVANSEESDDFFEFTAEDYYHLMSSKKEDKFLKTRKIREAEAAARRSKITKAVIRVRFPDNHTLEATFHPSESLQSVFDLLKKVVAKPEVPFYLYTTPPKKQIKDTKQDFFAAGFIPGAILYFSYDLPKDGTFESSPYLLEDVMSLKGLDLLPEPKNERTGECSSENMVSQPPVVTEERKPTEKRAVKPKWLKM